MKNKEYRFEYRRIDRYQHASWVKVDVRVMLEPESRAMIAFIYMRDINAEKKMTRIVNRVVEVDYETLALIYLNTGELEIIRKDDVNSSQDYRPYEDTILELTGQYFPKEKQEKSAIIFSRSDVTELFREQEQQRENLRNALLQAEYANSAKTQFLSRMSHEIRTLMNAIIGMNEHLSKPIDPQLLYEVLDRWFQKEQA